MDDKTLRQNVIDALDWNPAIDSAAIGVAAANGVVTLTGHVPNYFQKLEAERTTRAVKGVKAIAQEVEVRYITDTFPTDEDIAARAAQVLKWDVLIPLNAVKVKVSKGWITLTGQVNWDYQRRGAEADVRKLDGVTGVVNEITLKEQVSAKDIRTRIEDAFKRDALLDAERVEVLVADGKVTLKGKVKSWHERDAAERAAWSARGVRKVEDLVSIG